MKHKTTELTGALLDAAVAKAEGPDLLPDYWRDPEDGSCWMRPGREEWKPSTDWSQGGPIIERERIGLECGHEDGQWLAALPASRAMRDGPNDWDQYDKAEGWQIGPTPLVAAMRCYVASKFGEEVELPD